MNSGTNNFPNCHLQPGLMETVTGLEVTMQWGPETVSMNCAGISLAKDGEPPVWQGAIFTRPTECRDGRLAEPMPRVYHDKGLRG